MFFRTSAQNDPLGPPIQLYASQTDSLPSPCGVRRSFYRRADASQAITYLTSFPVDLAEAETTLALDGDVYYCDKASGRCLIEPIRLPLQVRADVQKTDVRIALTVTPFLDKQ